ncbi:hypothetical protein HPB47_010404, partial [Ixodes persulcatus]
DHHQGHIVASSAKSFRRRRERHLDRPVRRPSGAATPLSRATTESMRYLRSWSPQLTRSPPVWSEVFGPTSDGYARVVDAPGFVGQTGLSRTIGDSSSFTGAAPVTAAGA